MLEVEIKKLSNDASYYFDNTNAQIITLHHQTYQLDFQKLFPDKHGQFSKRCWKLPKASNNSLDTLSHPFPDKIKLSKTGGILAIQYGNILQFFQCK